MQPTKKPFTPEAFQEVGRDHLASNFHRVLGDQRGTGKTVQAILAAEKVGGPGVVGLVTCPASVRTSWNYHIKTHFGVEALKRWDVISYEGASNTTVRAGLRANYDVWIGDEIHKCKSIESKRSAAVLGRQGLARRARHKWPMSGTLTPNHRPVELYPLLKTMHPAFKDHTFATFTQRYCGAYYDGYSWNVKGASRIDELAEMLKGFVLRRTLAEVYPGRKEPIVSSVPLELTAADLAEVNAEEDAIGGREVRLSSRFDKYSQLGDTAHLLRLLGEAKVAKVAAFVEDKLEDVDKVVVFARHRSVIERLYKIFTLAGFGPTVYVGGMDDRQKDFAVRAFRDHTSHRVFIGQQDASGEGINGLQHAASVAVIAEPLWVPGQTEQIIGRLDRMDMMGDLVTAYVLYAADTLDEIVPQVHGRKERVGERLWTPAAAAHDFSAFSDL